MDFEGRGAERIDSENLLSFRLFDAEGRVFNEGMVKTLDISRTGVSIEAMEPFEPGLRIELSIGLGSEILKTIGIVRNHHKLDDESFQVGIEFEYLSSDELNKLATVYPQIQK